MPPLSCGYQDVICPSGGVELYNWWPVNIHMEVQRS